MNRFIIVSILIISKLMKGGLFYGQRQKNRANMNAFQLSPGQPKVLRYIQSHENCKLKDIAKECDVECATVSKMLDNLEEKGMIIRNINPQNKRAYQVNLTDKGRSALQKWEEHCMEVEQISLQGFNPEEKEQFQNYLSRMYTNLTGKKIL